MKTVNYYLQGFGFVSTKDYIASTFGYMASAKAITWSSYFALASTFLQDYLGFGLMVFSAFVALNIFEFRTGIKASKKLGKPILSRKMGRMFLKVGTYLAIIWMLHSFKKGFDFPKIMEFELNPFPILYWAFIAGIIYQLFKSLLENMNTLGWKEAGGALGFVMKKLNTIFEDESNSSK